MDKINNAKNTPEPRAYSQVFSGETIESSFVMEPGEQYGHDLGDFYTIDTQGVGVYGAGNKFFMTFSSIEQLKEFHSQLSRYIENQENNKSDRHG